MFVELRALKRHLVIGVNAAFCWLRIVTQRLNTLISRTSKDSTMRLDVTVHTDGVNFQERHSRSRIEELQLLSIE